LIQTIVKNILLIVGIIRFNVEFLHYLEQKIRVELLFVDDFHCLVEPVYGEMQFSLPLKLLVTQKITELSVLVSEGIECLHPNLILLGFGVGKDQVMQITS
jgi:hypothetical protein